MVRVASRLMRTLVSKAKLRLQILLMIIIGIANTHLTFVQTVDLRLDWRTMVGMDSVEIAQINIEL